LNIACLFYVTFDWSKKVANTTPMSAEEYDSGIEKTIPYYSHFYEQTVNLIEAFNYDKARWLDTGCGTGALVTIASKKFGDFEFILCDPSEEMIHHAQKRLFGNDQVKDFRVCGSEQINDKNEFDVITAIQCHHYLHEVERITAIQRCYEALKVNGVFISFENFAPNDEEGKKIALKRWGNYQIDNGKTRDEVNDHLSRYGKNYFPITIKEQFNILKNCGFRTIELFWCSYMQMGIYGVK